MIKKIVMCAIVCAFSIVEVAPLGFAQTSATGPSGSATAVVPQYLEFSMRIVKRMTSSSFDSSISPFNQGTDVSASPSFNFGTLSKVVDENPASETYGQLLYMRGQYFYYVLLMASTSGRKYVITESGTQLVSGTQRLANESVLLVPDYQWLDTIGNVAQGAPPTGAYVGPVTAATSATGTTESVVYQSETAGLSRIVRAIIVIGGPGAGLNYPTNYRLGYNGSSPQGAAQPYTSWAPITTSQVSGTYSGTVKFTLTLN
jgi:hypothetical protein